MVCWGNILPLPVRWAFWMKNWYVIALASCGLILAGAYLFYSQSKLTSEIKNDASVASSPASDTSSDLAGLVNNVSNSNKGMSVEKASSKPYLADVIQSHEEGDLDASYALYELSTTCPLVLERHYAAIASMNDSEAPAFLIDSANDQYERCQDASSLLDLKAMETELTETLTAAKEPRYMALKLAWIQDNEGRAASDKQAVDILESLDGNAIGAIIPYLNQRPKALPRQAPPSLEQQQLLEAKIDALKLLACQNDWSACPRQSLTMAVLCAAKNDEDCYRNYDMIEYMKAYEWSPVRTDTAYATLREIKSLINNGNAMQIVILGDN
jgi:hypothetical protein